MKMIIVFIALLSFTSLFVFAHGDNDHKQKTKTEQKAIETGNKQAEKPLAKTETTAQNDENVFVGLDKFPTLHPLIVHFPIVLLIVAFFTQIAGFFTAKKPLGIITLVILIAGVITAYLSAEVFHPHTEGLTAKMALMLEEHEEFAEFTLWFAAAATVFKILTLFLNKKKLLTEIVVAVFLFLSVASVGITGHYGAQLIHLEGIGAQGKYLETDE